MERHELDPLIGRLLSDPEQVALDLSDNEIGQILDRLGETDIDDLITSIDGEVERVRLQILVSLAVGRPVVVQDSLSEKLRVDRESAERKLAVAFSGLLNTLEPRIGNLAVALEKAWARGREVVPNRVDYLAPNVTEANVIQLARLGLSPTDFTAALNGISTEIQYKRRQIESDIIYLEHGDPHVDQDLLLRSVVDGTYLSEESGRALLRWILAALPLFPLLLPAFRSEKVEDDIRFMRDVRADRTAVDRWHTGIAGRSWLEWLDQFVNHLFSSRFSRR